MVVNQFCDCVYNVINYRQELRINFNFRPKKSVPPYKAKELIFNLYNKPRKWV